MFQVLENKCVLAKTGLEYLDISDFKNETEYKAAKKRTRYLSIFNLKGENCYPENFKELHILDTAGQSDINKSLSRYIAFISLNFDEKTSVFIYDCDLQKITEWLAKDFFKLEINRTLGGKAFNLKKSINDTLKQSKLIYEKNKLKLITLNTKGKNKPNVNYSDEEDQSESSVELGSAHGPRDADVDNDVPFSNYHTSIAIQKRSINTFFNIQAGKLFYFEIEWKKDTIVKEIKLNACRKLYQ